MTGYTLKLCIVTALNVFSLSMGCMTIEPALFEPRRHRLHTPRSLLQVSLLSSLSVAGPATI